MATTTQITNIAGKLDLTDYAGDFETDYDMDAVHADYVDALDQLLPEGIALFANGDVVAVDYVADEARELDFDELAEQIDVAAIFERHDRTARLLPAIKDATSAVERAELQRVAAIRAAKDSGRFTVGEIARAAGMTRDGVYKMLNRGGGEKSDFSNATHVRNRVMGTVRTRVLGTDDWVTPDFPGEVVTTEQLEALPKMAAEEE